MQFEPHMNKTIMTFIHITDSDHPGHLPSLISHDAYAFSRKLYKDLSFYSVDIRLRFRTDLANAQADLGLLCFQRVKHTLLVSLAMMLLILVHVHYSV